MKKILTFVLFCCSLFVKAQTNLVVNPSFEDTINCPSLTGEINKATGWVSFCGSPDYFNTCYTADPFTIGVPYNGCGYQTPASGNAYAGFATFSNSFPNAREFPACSLTGSLIVGTKYYVSFKVALALTSYSQLNYATDKMGVRFTTGTYICNALIDNVPPIYTNSIITDSLNWTRITGSFIADSAYAFVVIGNFFDDANTDTLKFFNDFQDNSYYYLDDICVSTDSLYANNYYYTGITQNYISDKISCYPNPVIDALNIKNLSNEKINIEIYNVFGEQVFSGKDVSNENIILNLTQISSGVLFIKITSGKQFTTFKLLKQ